jgi:tetratricopeptide (TPR) repeat protein
MEKFEKAEESFRTAYELEPDNTKAYLFVGRSILQQGEVGKSVNIFRSIIQREPEQRAEVYYWLGRALGESADKAQALSAYEKATEFSKGIIESRPDILVRRGKIYTDLGYFGRAKDDFTKARNYLKENADIYLGLADVYLEQDRYDRAIEVLETGLEFNRENKHLHYKIGNAYVQEENRELGVKHLQRAKDLGHEDPKIHRMLGYLYRDLGQDDNAVDAFKNYLARADTDKMAASTKKEVINQIERLGGSL